MINTYLPTEWMDLSVAVAQQDVLSPLGLSDYVLQQTARYTKILHTSIRKGRGAGGTGPVVWLPHSNALSP